MRKLKRYVVLGMLGLMVSSRASGDPPVAGQVVVYSSLDPEFAEPVLRAYAKRTGGVEVLPKFDVESTKTVGLTNAIIAEKPPARAATCSGTTRSSTRSGSRSKGCSRRSSRRTPATCPTTFKAKDGTWYGFAGRARILIVNTKLVPEADRPEGHQRPARPEVEGEDRHRQAALRHDRHARRLPVRRLGRREGQGSSFAT